MANILIIGGGVAGLSAGIYAQRAGHHATVCERHRVAGGNLTGWQRGEYHIDNCIHWLTGTNPQTDTYKMWCELGALGKGIEVLQGESLFSCERGCKRLTLWRDLDRTEREMLALSPEDAGFIRSFTGTVRAIQGFCSTRGAKHIARNTPKELLCSIPGLGKHFFMSTGALAKRVHHPLLGDFFVGLMGEEFSALALCIVTAIFCGDNGGLPAGGSFAMAERMARRLEELGGELLLSKEAVSAVTREGRVESVTFADGSKMDADCVILAADPAVLYPRLFSRSMPPQLTRLYRSGAGLRFSSVHCAFACDIPKFSFTGDLILPLSPMFRARLGHTHLLLREYSHEERSAPRGKSLLQAMIPCDESRALEWVALARDKDAYQARKAHIAENVQAIVLRRFPSLAGKMELLDTWTPATYKRYTGSQIGSWMGFIMQPARLPISPSVRDKHFENLFFATQWLRSPGGLPSAAMEGKRAVDTMVKVLEREHAGENRKHFHLSPA